MTSQNRDHIPSGCPLTQGELAIISQIAHGHSYSQIAKQTRRAESTIRNQANRARRRLQVQSTIGCVLVGIRDGWLTIDGDPNYQHGHDTTIPVRPEDQVTVKQAVYLEALVRWTRTHNPDDREEAESLAHIVLREAHEDGAELGALKGIVTKIHGGAVLTDALLRDVE